MCGGGSLGCWTVLQSFKDRQSKSEKLIWFPEPSLKRRIPRDVQIKHTYTIAQTPSIHPLTLRHRRQHTLRPTTHPRPIRHSTTFPQARPQLRIPQLHSPRARLVGKPNMKSLVLQFPPISRNRHASGIDIQFVIDGRAVGYG